MARHDVRVAEDSAGSAEIFGIRGEEARQAVEQAGFERFNYTYFVCTGRSGRGSSSSSRVYGDCGAERRNEQIRKGWKIGVGPEK